MENLLKTAVIVLCLCCLVFAEPPPELNKAEPELIEDGVVNEDNKLGIKPNESPKGENDRRRREIDRSTCEQKYLDLYENHTMCLVDVGVSNSVLSDAEKTAIVKQHNDYRKGVQPTATNILKLIWDDDIAIVAAKWARQCVRGHDGGTAHAVPELPKVYIGQNAAYGFYSYEAAIKAWYDEVADYKFGVGRVGADVTKKVGHYTQVVSAVATRIGCGSAYCENSEYASKIHHICNYAVGQSSIQYPYISGTSAAACPNKRSGNLCDCGGKLCFNGGTIDISTCTCTCPALYKGDLCETLNCPTLDPSSCSIYTLDKCQTNLYVRNACPQRCGICPKPCNGLSCQNLGTLDLNTCKCQCLSDYSGTSCETLTCPTSQSWWCASRTTDDCTRYYNLPYICLIQCGSCEKPAAPCNGLSCQNLGTLDLNTCKCQCLSDYSGTSCETLTCPTSQSSWCASRTTDDCTRYYNLPYICPIQCGSCEKPAAPCNGLICENDGTLDKTACTCKCQGSYYSGDRCQTLTCPTSVSKSCATLASDACTRYWNVKYLCPMMCGKCGPLPCGKICRNYGTLTQATCT
ncbi:multiple epidermal growth factor-like domains protein 10 isoform X2 [Gigantopelta aegis]|uniref:multiple epidermal growth factor-like domains protein 10 isoform X2 n=1 Tax=Gigantopelta aegis TaxID=1735272 RepID=UPI001B88B2C8|nr:multiple epidermal growth factor-like domains protein 10 isoform X2 [Gigantopelta aegis]